MERERMCLRVGAAAIGCAVVLRLAGSGFFTPALAAISREPAASALVYLETGRVVRLPPPPEPTMPPETEPPETLPLLSFAAEGVTIRAEFDYDPDVEALLRVPLDWQLAGEAPTVLILHTHATESYTQEGEAYRESGAYRTLDKRYNMLAVGDRLARLLKAGGVGVIQDESLHDYPSYTGAYDSSRQSLQEYLRRYPTIRLVLDLHRDAAEDGAGNQVADTVNLDGRDSALLMIVAGSDTGGLYHPAWEENLALAVKLQAVLEERHPGLCRSLRLSTQRFNQDLSPGALLIEVGSAGNTQAQAMAAVDALAQGILALSGGTATEDSTR